MKQRSNRRKFIVTICIMLLGMLYISAAYGDTEVAINATNFPDDAFRERVRKFDIDGNGKLSQTETAAVREIYIPMCNIESLKGIEYFTLLKKLWCSNNKLTELDVSKNKDLRVLYCSSNELTELDVSKNMSLEWLFCDSNKLTELDVSMHYALEWFQCGYNNLTQLDVHKNKALEILSCESNQLTTLDVSNNIVLEGLWCESNKLTSLDVSKNTALHGLYCDHNQLTALDVSKNLALKRLECPYNQLTTLDISNNTALDDIDCSSNKLTALNVSNNTALKLLNCSSNKLVALEVGKNTALNVLDCSSNMLTTLNVSKNTSLERLYCSSNKLTKIDVNRCKTIYKMIQEKDPYEEGTKFVWAIDSNNDNTDDIALEVDTNVAVPGFDTDNYLRCIKIDEYNFPDSAFRGCVARICDIDGNKRLSDAEIANVKELNIDNENIKDLTGIELFTEMTILRCAYNHISSIDLTSLTKLVELDCSDNPISTLDVSSNTALETLICGDTYLKTIDLSNNPALSKLMCEQYCYGWNELISINVSFCPALNSLVIETEYGNSVIPNHSYLFNHLLHGWFAENADGTLSKYLFVGNYVEVTTNKGIYKSNIQKPASQPETVDKVVAFVTRCYSIILNREPDAGGLQTWINELTSGRKAASEIIDRFVNSTEFQGKNYSKGDAVEILYKAMLGRGSDPAGKANWVGKLENGQPFAAVINGFCESREFTEICASYGIKPGSVTIPEQPTAADEKIKAFVQRCYRIILNRDPDEGGMNTWFNELKSRRKAASEIIDRFVNSPEFQGKNYSKADAVEVLYNAMLGRSSDAAGKANWVGKLENGHPFAVVINGFCVSKEFTGICASYGIKPGSVTVQPLSGVADEEALSMLALNAKEPITRRSETKPNRVEIINPSDTIDMNIGTAVQAVYINEEKAKEFISRCYRVILSREASAAELENWIGQMVNGTKTPDQIARGFLFSNEFKGKNTGNEDLVKILYRVYMNREADPEGLKTWTEELDNGTTLNDLLNAFSKTNEFKKVVSEMSK